MNGYPSCGGCATRDATIDTLRERVRQLEQALVAPDWPQLGFTPTEWRIFRLLLARSRLSRDAAMVALYGHRASEMPDPKILDVWLVRLRRRLRPHGIAIVTHHGFGWDMPADAKAKARALIEARDQPIERPLEVVA